MRSIEGTATISLETLDGLRECETLFRSVRNSASGLIERVDSEQYEKKCKEIDAMKDISDDDLTRLLKEAAGTLQIIVSAGCLRRLIREFIDSEKSDVYYELAEMTKEEFARIPLILESEHKKRQIPKIEDLKQAKGQQDTSVCEMCEAYMADAECDLKEDCPAAGIVKRLKEAEEKIKVKEKTIKIKIETIKKRDEEIRELKKKLDDSELKRSYMINPMAIGDRHEMGG